MGDAVHAQDDALTIHHYSFYPPDFVWCWWVWVNRSNSVRNFFATIIRGIGIVLGAVLLMFGGGIGLENLQAPGTINIPIFIFSVAAILVGSIMLWLVLKKK